MKDAESNTDEEEEEEEDESRLRSLPPPLAALSNSNLGRSLFLSAIQKWT